MGRRVKAAQAGSGPGVRRRGQLTRTSIIRAARQLLLRRGYADFVFREVAASIGIEPANVQYYFPSKRDLVWAVLQPELENYAARLRSAIEAGGSREEKISAMVTFLLGDIKASDTLRLWLAIWGMAAHDVKIARVTRDWYREYVATLATLIEDTVPEVSRAQAEEAACFITSLFDGLMVLLHIGKPQAPLMKRLEPQVHDTVWQILSARSADGE